MSSRSSVVTVGAFDAVHLGHRALLDHARTEASKRDARVVALSFDPHPLAALRPGAEPARLTRWDDRVRLLQGAGADEVVRLEPTSEFLALPPEAFIRRVVEDHNAVAWIEGGDFRFGKGRAGDVGLLATEATRLGFDFELIEQIDAELHDQSVVRVSSSMIRWLLARGRVADAAKLLGRPHALSGTAVRGHRRGRTIGFPTANMDLGADAPLVPAEGVYAGSATLPDGRAFPAAISVGTNPTFKSASGPNARTVEPHLIGCPAEGDAIAGLPEYGWDLAITFEHWIRDTVRFGGVEQLIAQLERDVERTTESLGAAETSRA